VGQLPLVLALVVGIVFIAENRAEPSTVCTPAGLLSEVVSQNEPS
jgi:hypothetical protein